jgi:hypothetical protein
MFVASMLLVATGCKRTGKAEQLAALESAYKAGLLTKDEYDAKRLALTVAEPAATLAPAPGPSSSRTTTTSPNITQGSASQRANAPPTAAPIRSSAPPYVARAIESEPAPLRGCEDAEYKSGGQKGAEERFFAAPPEMVRRAAISALDSLDFNIHKNSNNEIEAGKKRHIGVIVGAGGERVILTFQRTEQGGQSGTRVIGHTKKNFVGHVTQKTWTDAVLAQIGCKLREPRR